jgi:hypothetical protein
LKFASFPSYWKVYLEVTGIPILAVSEFFPKLYSPWRLKLPVINPVGAHFAVMVGEKKFE